MQRDHHITFTSFHHLFFVSCLMIPLCPVPSLYFSFINQGSNKSLSFTVETITLPLYPFMIYFFVLFAGSSCPVPSLCFSFINQVLTNLSQINSISSSLVFFVSFADFFFILLVFFLFLLYF